MHENGTVSFAHPANSTGTEDMLSPQDDLVMLCEEVSMIGVDDDSADKIDSNKIQGILIEDDLDREADIGRLKTIRDLRFIIDHQKLTIRNLQTEVHKLITNN